MFKLVVFDWNGVILSDTKACFESDNYIISHYGGTPVDMKTYKDTIVIPAIDFYTLHGCDRKKLVSNTKKLGDLFRNYCKSRSAKCRTRSGSRHLLKFIKNSSMKAIILSNDTVKDLNSQLKRLGMEDYFESVLANTENDTSMKKQGKGQKLKKYLRKQNYKSSEIIIIGDSPEEAEIAQKQGLSSVLITGGYYSKKRLIAATPDFLISNLKEFIPILQEKRS